MISLFDGLRDLNFLSILVRMMLSVCCGAVIGLERSSKNRPAGFRTHILVCVGAATASLTGHYIYLVMKMPADVTRIGAQVVTGLGFIGTGAIIVTKRQVVKGLTTAAGLWTCGIVGLALGAGFYEGALLCAALVLFVETVFSNIGMHIVHVPEFQIMLGYEQKEALDHMMRFCKNRNIAITDLQITGKDKDSDEEHIYKALVSLRPNSKVVYENLIEYIEEITGVVSAEVILAKDKKEGDIL